MAGKPAFTIAQMRAMAQRRLPRFVFDFVDGGAGSEQGLARNMAAFADIRLCPRVLTGCENRSMTRALLGESFAAPFGIAPIGLANLTWPGADLALARAATRANIPYMLSTAGTTALEEIAAAAPRHAWFQLYVGRDAAITDDLIRRADVAGFPVLCVTVDVPAPGKRVRDLVNGFSLPLKPSVRLALDLALHPRWSLATLRAGAPRFANLEVYAAKGASTQSLAQLMAAQSSARLDWGLLAEIRRAWPRKLVVKGVLDPEDARRLVEMGIDGIVVSNHGGRQLDAAAATIEAAPPIIEAVGGRIPVMLDGGLRSGEDIARALAVGADFVFAGRPFLYGIGALGPARGPEAVIALLRDELDRAMAMLGCADLSTLDPTRLFKA